MHTTKISKTVFIHHGDFSGDVKINLPSGPTFSVPAEDLLGLVGEIVRIKRISELEGASARGILGMNENGADE